MPQSQSLNIPLRTSSVNAVGHGMIGTTNIRQDPTCEKASKAQRILGTTNLPLPQDHQEQDKKKTRRPSFLRAPELRSQKSAGFMPFPSVPPEATLPQPQLRVRASSPLLGQEYRSQDVSQPPVPALPKKIHHSGSSSALFSYFNPRDSTIEPVAESRDPTKSSALSEKTAEIQNRTEPRLSMRQPKGPMKESKRKMRPPRIDLSMLFPKPRSNAAPLLSPHRMVDSPSPVSVVSEHSVAKEKKADSHVSGKRLTKNPPSPRASTRHPSERKTAAAEPYETSTPDWADPSLVRTVRTSEMDLALDNYSDIQKETQFAERSRPGRLNSRPRSRGRTQDSDSRSTDTSLRKVPSNNSVGGWSKETYLSPKTCAQPPHNRPSNPPNTRRADLQPPRSKGAMSRKSSKSTLKNIDLNVSSVLCLSSSEDEDDEDGLKDKSERNKRDSVGTLGDLEAEICTASAAQATKGTLRRVERPASTATRGSQVNGSRQPRPRNPGSSTTTLSRSRRSSGVPAISEPEFLHGDPMFSQLRSPTTLSQKELNRRSRIMTVTKQEESLLEAMRQRRGKITPSIFHHNGTGEADRRSVVSGPSRDSFYCSDTSFLRLSPGLPPNPARPEQGANHITKDGPTFKGTTSDTEQRTMYSSTSPRASLVYSESLPSPATSGASPMTPTLPIHRFSSIYAQKPPPNYPPPAIPEVSRRHSRRRTDSSEAIVLGEVEAPTERSELPIWALGWSENTNLTTVH
ncbi:hypothetical protein FE257_000646 [Aspergillus nanangensis]|uniref:Uncharacterized protein n=1 Tax=Aspergillus nanangensis TaxID=2582783 RepID=A0AAD4CEY8_ASPNN|nr:hypothetical protein FE257_000646 [Aspergillus nanangensis]